MVSDVSEKSYLKLPGSIMTRKTIDIAAMSEKITGNFEYKCQFCAGSNLPFDRKL